MGGWDAYALAAPADRLLPFVLSRPATGGGASAWVNCAWIEHADTGARIATLLPTGGTAGSPPPNALVLSRATDAARNATHFIYSGGIIPGLALPCGVPLRLVLDNAYQSPRFLAYTDLSGFLSMEWWHGGPLAGVPYGTGMRQHFYVDAAALAYAPTARKKDVTLDSATGLERLDFLSLLRTATLNTEPLPGYLLEAFDGLEAHSNVLLDGEAWKVKEVKATTSGPEGGRSSLSVTVEQQQVVISRAGLAPLLPVRPFNAVTDAPRPWRCGDTTDTAADYQTFQRTCGEDANGNNSGGVNWSQRDMNPGSATFNATRTVLNAETDVVLCPLPHVYQSALVSGQPQRNNCPAGQSGTAVTYTLAAGLFTSLSDQATADQAARDHYAATAQAYANQHGACVAGGPGGTGAVYNPVYTAAGCFACQLVNAADPADVRDATDAEAAQYYVNGVMVNGRYESCPGCP